MARGLYTHAHGARPHASPCLRPDVLRSRASWRGSTWCPWPQAGPTPLLPRARASCSAGGAGGWPARELSSPLAAVQPIWPHALAATRAGKMCSWGGRWVVLARPAPWAEGARRSSTRVCTGMHLVAAAQGVLVGNASKMKALIMRAGLGWPSSCCCARTACFRRPPSLLHTRHGQPQVWWATVTV